MQYTSTRAQAAPVSGAQAIVAGIAPDGGLYIPETLPTFSYDRIKRMQDLNYPELAAAVLDPFLNDFSSQELSDAAGFAYAPERFAHPDVCPLVMVEPGLAMLELWHGPTSAFKDMALQILPHLMRAARTKCGEEKESVILVATSGDTGKAALEGFRDVAGTRVVVFYPQTGVSRVQKLQMVTQEGQNVAVAAVAGNFDDAQRGVKEIFADEDFSRELADAGFVLSSANSINWGRLVPQIVYYFSAYQSLLKQRVIRDGETVNVAVPTGNFGNILAAFYARKMGLPIHRLICAANANHILADFIQTGLYDTQRPFHKTMSPSMDILVSSNLERLLFEATGRDGSQIRAWMRALAEKGRYSVNGEPLQYIQSIFWAGSASEADTADAIVSLFNSSGYLMDPHTAVGYHVVQEYRATENDDRPIILASTANPFKFSGAAASALGLRVGDDEMEAAAELARHSGWSVPAHLASLTEKEIRHTTQCQPEQMKQTVRALLGV
jgi:threonine synthase